MSFGNSGGSSRQAGDTNTIDNSIHDFSTNVNGDGNITSSGAGNVSIQRVDGEIIESGFEFGEGVMSKGFDFGKHAINAVSASNKQSLATSNKMLRTVSNLATTLKTGQNSQVHKMYAMVAGGAIVVVGVVAMTTKKIKQ